MRGDCCSSVHCDDAAALSANAHGQGRGVRCSQAVRRGRQIQVCFRRHKYAHNIDRPYAGKLSLYMYVIYDQFHAALMYGISTSYRLILHILCN